VVITPSPGQFLSVMPKVPRGLRLNPKELGRRMGNRIKPESEHIALDRPPDMISRIPTDTHGRGIRNTQFRLPYLSNLRKMDPIFDDPYDVAAQAIRKTQKPGDPEVILDPDGLYEEDDAEGFHSETRFNWMPKKQRLEDRYRQYERTAQYENVVAATGMSEKYIQSLMIRPLYSNFVTNQTRNGKIFSMYALSVVGNGDGLVGFGEGKSDFPSVAIHVANMRAIKHMVPVQRFENRTIYGDIYAKFGATKVTLRSRPPGFGVRANYYIHEICRCAGISDISAKVLGSTNGMNIVKAVFEAIRLQKLPSTIARERGKHVIDVRERYYHAR
jgi:small subunit ribosomal protein S5